MNYVLVRNGVDIFCEKFNIKVKVHPYIMFGGFYIFAVYGFS